MNLFKQIAFAAALSTSALLFTVADANDIKAGDIVIHDPWIKATLRGADAGAAFAKIENTGKEDDVLLSATLDGVPVVQVHEMKMEGDVMKMNELKDGLSIPAGKTVELKPGSYHIMLMSLKSGFKAKDEVKGTLTFKKAGKIDVAYEVKDDMGGMSMPGMKKK